MTTDEENVTWVLQTGIVRRAIENLTHKRAHPFFLAYLHLRSRAILDGDQSAIRPRWNDLGQYLQIPGGPPKKPYYRPVFDPPGNPSRYWLNENLAGSFAPSSLREGMPALQVVRKEGNHAFALRPDHAFLALKHLLYGKPIDINPFVVFMYRDFGVVTDGEMPIPFELINIFRQDWHFYGEEHREEFDVLFTHGELSNTKWFVQHEISDE